MPDATQLVGGRARFVNSNAHDLEGKIVFPGVACCGGNNMEHEVKQLLFTFPPYDGL